VTLFSARSLGNSSQVKSGNVDPPTVEGFGNEWRAFDQSALEESEWQTLFERYFNIFPWDDLPERAEGFDLGCGSGRWAAGVAPRVGRLHCIDPALEALTVARRNLADLEQVEFHHAAVDAIPLADDSQDFGYCLGVLHHVPDTAAGLASCVAKLKVGAPFLLYLYYALDNRGAGFRAAWHISDLLRRGISRLPFVLRRPVCDLFAALVYWPLARGAALGEAMGLDVAHWPLSPYRRGSFYTMRTDTLDRLGTRLEQRFSRQQIAVMMEAAGLGDIRFSENVPYWVALGYRRG
jgi:SAM-dependent methyltransferase